MRSDLGDDDIDVSSVTMSSTSPAVEVAVIRGSVGMASPCYGGEES